MIRYNTTATAGWPWRAWEEPSTCWIRIVYRGNNCTCSVDGTNPKRKKQSNPTKKLPGETPMVKSVPQLFSSWSRSSEFLANLFVSQRKKGGWEKPKVYFASQRHYGFRFSFGVTKRRTYTRTKKCPNWKKKRIGNAVYMCL